jgi:3-oxoacyl-(acyl-carrier-protein) synthase/3-hydroxymyristoyl/3-hydroxydecanoyl-(acyl carrier protein) dehydratase
MNSLPRVAIVGMGGLFSQSPTLEQFWANIKNGIDTAREVPSNRWHISRSDAFHPAPGTKDRAYSTRACLIDEADLDPNSLSPADRGPLDPLFRVLLQAGSQAWFDAVTTSLDHGRVGVAIGNIVLPTEIASRLTQTVFGSLFDARILGRKADALLGESELEGLHGAAQPATILARMLGLTGGSFTLDAACASSLYAIKLAADRLQGGEADAMLAGGLSRPDCLYTQMGFSQLRALSARGRCSPFDAEADGLVVGEGAGIFLLKRLEDALKHGDHIYATLAGCGLSNDREGKLLAPSAEGQLRAMRAAYKLAGWLPTDVDLIECHAPGTPVGDAVEFASLLKLREGASAKAQACVIGSVKSNIGHTLTAAGSAGLLKVLLALKNNTLPPTANYRSPARDIALSGSPYRILSHAEQWERRHPGQARRAAVSAFGFGGINAHLLAEEWTGETAGQQVFTTGMPRGKTALAVVGMAATVGKWKSLGAWHRALGKGNKLERPEAKRHNWGLQGRHLSGYHLEELVAPLDRFRIPPKELEELLPQQLLMLQVAADALADCRFEETRGERSGTFIGLDLDWNTTNFSFRWSLINRARKWAHELGLDLSTEELAAWVDELRQSAGPALSPNRVMGALGSVVASRVAREFHIGGPSFTISNEENSGLRGLEIGCRMLRNHEIDQTLIGAVDFPGDPRHQLTAWRESEGNRTKITAEGAVALVIKRHDDAIASGDKIYAIIDDIQSSAITDHDETGAGEDRADWRVGAATGLVSLVKAIISPLGDQTKMPDELPPGGKLKFESTSKDGNRFHVTFTRGQAAEQIVGEIADEDFVTKPHVTMTVGGEPFNVPRPQEVLSSREQAQERHSPRTQSAPVPSTEYTSNSFEVVTALMQPLITQTALRQEAVSRAHESHLHFVNHLNEVLGVNLSFALEFARECELTRSDPGDRSDSLPMKERQVVSSQATVGPFLDRSKCLEFAIGSIAKVLGAQFAAVDGHPTRVRLPDEPLMLVDRILSVSGNPASLTSGTVVTEHDILPKAWYLDCGRIPTCIAVEAGQADLFLAGYLGIDFRTRGLAVYRLLDAVVTFHCELPRPGEVIHYEIRIDHFFRQGNTYLFRFSFEGTVNGQPLLTMRDGCAGFFTREELAAGKGIVQTTLDKKLLTGKRPKDWRDLVPMEVESYDDQQIARLRAGDLAGCFGSLFGKLPFNNPLGLPSGRMKLVDRVPLLDPHGGRFGLGLIRGEADIHPDDWFLTCHFVDDRVMPGTLMYECCLHTLRIFLMRLGWVGEADAVVCQPVLGIASRLKCRGQVIETTRKVTYEVVIKEIGYRPEPYVLADALMFADGKPIVEITDMSLRLSGLTREGLESLWSSQIKRPLFDHDRILAFAVGKPSEAFGEPYRVFDRERVIARLPGPPYQFLDRITAIQAEPWKMVAGGVIEAEYDVPVDAWYFEANRQPYMPYAVLLEIALQPCGWLAAYLGSALTSPVDLAFRNLGGEAIQHRLVDRSIGTLTTSVRITQVSHSGGMIIQHFEFDMRAKSGPVFEGKTYFGFFSRESLANQVGIRDAKVGDVASSTDAGEVRFPFPQETPFPDRRLRMIDEIVAFRSAKRHGRPHAPREGIHHAERDVHTAATMCYIRGVKTIDPNEWFFKAHFYQDPVWPGSLGVEAFVQLLKAFALRHWGESDRVRFETPVPGHKHRWTYRGQVTPADKQVTVEASIKAIDEDQRILYADGYLSVDGRVIYRMEDFTLGSS